MLKADRCNSEIEKRVVDFLLVIIEELFCYILQLRRYG